MDRTAGSTGPASGGGTDAADPDSEVDIATGDSAEPSGKKGEQRVTWAELFFDLVWVFALVQISGVLASAYGPLGLAQTLILLVPLWWGWMSATLLGNSAGVALDRPAIRMMLFALAACGLGMTVAIPHAYEQHGLLFALCYVVMRALLWAGMRKLPLFGDLRIEPFGLSLLLASPLFLAGGLTSGAARTALWGTAAVLEVAVPVLFGHRLDRFTFETSHLPERFGLVIIMALGETVLAVGTNASDSALGPARFAALAVSFTVIVGLWWTYFHFGAAAVRHSLQTDPVQARIVRDVFNYGHFIYLTAIIFLAVGLKKICLDPLAVPHSLPEMLLAPSAALYLFGFCYSRWRMFGAAGVSRFSAAAFCLLLTPVALSLPMLVTGVIVAAVLVGLNVFEYWIVTTGRRILFLHMPHWKR
ncbi:low temperature requirement protein A [Streptomyces omiyaensis]|uniref:Low temperature requirement protein A n=1 Tax=Streptomyces omiyaensis TaxID=68247 RepID=A0ABW7BM91_9ACTN|nr:low temperature requirement protein A [Streptomyces omiyaensis]GGY27356.1 membrane protein [Streptomyces omiyaensis]